MSDEIFRSLRWVASAKAFSQVVSWVATIVVMRLLAPQDYGLVAMATLFSGFLLFLGDLGLGTALISRRSVPEDVLRAAYGASLAVGLTLCVLTVLAAPLVGAYFQNSAVTGLVRATGLLFIAVGISTVPRALLAVDMRFREISIAGMFSSVLATATTLLLAWRGFGAWSLISGSVAGALVRAVQLHLYVGRLPRPTLAIAPLRGLLRLSGYLLANMSVWYWYEQIDALIVGRRLGDAPLGLLTVGKELAFLPVSKVVEVTNQVALPSFSRLQDNPQNVADAYAKSIRLSSITGFPILWGLALTANDLVYLLLGSKWMAAVIVIQILCIVMPLRFAGALAAAVLQGIGRPDVTFWYTTQTLAISAALLLVGTSWGLVGVGIAWAISIPLGFALSLRALVSCVPARATAVLGDIGLAAAPALIMAVSVAAVQFAMTQSTPALRLTVSITVGCTIWLIAVRICANAIWQELTAFGMRFLRA
jgi:O-antigen/teichoic acid export membrane protein